jgi:hypothetical protein
VKIYVAVVEALMKKERQGVTQETIPPLNADVFFCRFIGISPCV